MQGTQRGGQAGQGPKNVQKDIRDSLARIAQCVEGSKTNMAARTMEAIGHLNELNDVHDKMETHQDVKPREYAADAKIFSTITECVWASAKGLNTNQVGRLVPDLCVALKSQHVHRPDAQQEGAQDPEAFCWGALGARIGSMFRVAPGVNCMYGPLEARPKERKAAVRRAKAVLEAVVRPDELAQIEENDKQETDKNMEAMWRIVNTRGVVPWAELVCNHASYAQTVENAFTLAFLVRDNRVALEHEAARGMLVRGKGSARDAKAAKERGEPSQAPVHVEARQFVMKLDQDDWAMMKRVVAPGDCLMPHRAAQHHDGDVPPPRAKRPATQTQAQTQAHEEEEEEEEEDEEEEAEEEGARRGAGGSGAAGPSGVRGSAQVSKRRKS